MTTDSVEPWLLGTLIDTAAVQRAVLHALELAAEDIEKWCSGLSDEELNARPFGVAPVAFHLRHIARSLDRLLMYAEGHDLSNEQLGALRTELAPSASHKDLFAELSAAIARSSVRIRAFDAAHLDEPRAVGRRQLPTTIGGLLVHMADHTQRHVGQAITTSKIIRGMRWNSEGNR